MTSGFILSGNGERKSNMSHQHDRIMDQKALQELGGLPNKHSNFNRVPRNKAFQGLRLHVFLYHMLESDLMVR